MKRLDSPQLLTNEKAGVGDVAAESGRIADVHSANKTGPLNALGSNTR